MSESPKNRIERGQADDEAAAWVLRCDRGLTASEQAAYSEWLATDSSRWALLSRYLKDWERLDKLAVKRLNCEAPDPDFLLKRPRIQNPWVLALSLGAAAAVALGIILRWPNNSAQTALTTVEERALEDGSTIQLNGNSAVTVRFSPVERYVSVDRGEVQFTVAKDPARPFIVNTGGVWVRAVGTAFDIRRELSNVAVLVTEGRVQIDRLVSGQSLGRPISDSQSNTLATQVPVLRAGQRALVSLSSNGPPPQIANVTADEMTRLLSWQTRLLDFTSAQLGDVIAEFNRHNAVQLSIPDPSLSALRITASFRSDNVEGFVRLLESSFGIQVKRIGTSEIVLSKARQ
jgi:transmembrane sensor